MDLREAFGRGAEKYGTLELPFEAYASSVRERVRRRLERNGIPPTEEGISDVLGRSEVGDLYLAVACDRGVPGAWDLFAALHSGVLEAMAIRRGARRGEEEEIAREILGDLFSPPPSGGARTRLGTFDGTAKLTAWLGVIVERRLADRRRSDRPRAAAAGAEPGASREVALASVPSREGDPAAHAVEAETARRFAQALAGAWGTLTDREALALRLRYRHDLPQTAVARMLRVGEPRVSRLLRGAEEKLRAALARGTGGDDASVEDPGRLRRLLRDSVADWMATSETPREPDPGEESTLA